MFKPVEKALRKPFRTNDNDETVDFYLDEASSTKFTPKEEKENFEALDRLRNYMGGIIGGYSDPIMARSYKAESEKDNFSICVHGYRLNGMEDKHPMMQYLSQYPGLTITQEDQQYCDNVWIFTFPKTECGDILKGMKLLNLDDDLLQSLSREAKSQAVLC